MSEEIMSDAPSLTSQERVAQPFTQGPWFSAPTGHQMRAASMSHAIATADLKQVVAGCFEDVTGGEAEAGANARLIAAAPKMLDALQWIEGCASVLMSHTRLSAGSRGVIRDIAAKAREASEASK